MTKHFTFLLFMLFSVFTAFAQQGEIQGKVTDTDSGEGLPFANVAIKVGGVTTGAQTDFDGYYSIKPIPPGTYDVTTSYLGYQSNVTKGVLVTADKSTFLDIKMAEESEILAEVVVVDYKVPLIKADETSTGTTVTKEDIDNLPTRNVNSIASTSAGVYQEDEGESVNVKGSRSESTDYYIDGIKVRGSSQIPTQSIEQVTVLTGGLPARYGDAIGGIINVTTRGPSNQFSGGVELITSQFLDPYGYNLATGFLSGPLLKINKGTEQERPILGFLFSGEYLREKDDDPSALGIYVVKDEVLNNLRTSPLILQDSQSGGIFQRSSEFITADDLELLKYKPNAVKDRIGATLKLDFQPVSGLNFTFGGTYNFENRNEWLRTYTLANSDGNPDRTDETFRGFVRFTQRFGNQNLDADSEPSVFSNAYYSIQLDYTKDLFQRQSNRHQDRFFDYGYVGQFASNRIPSLGFTSFPELGDEEFDLRPVLNGFSNQGVNFTPGIQNPDMASHTQQYFNLANGDLNFINSVNLIEAQGGLVNGSRILSSQTMYNIWYNPGRVFNGFSKAETDQYRVVFNGSFDIKSRGKKDRNKHAIEFGLEYEQRIDRSWGINPVGLWPRMRLDANNHLDAITEDSKGRPNLFVLVRPNEDNLPYTILDYRDAESDLYDENGNINEGNVEYVSIYDYESEGNFIDNYDLLTYQFGASSNPSYFAQNIRNAIGVGADDWVDVDNLDPSNFSLDMFSATELIDAGVLGGYYGYNYLGEKFSSQPRFEDFFTQRDGAGNLSFDVPAFQPIYAAGFIQDKFAFKDLVFNVGLRVDRYDANQKVLKDPYSLFGVRTAEEITEYIHPDNVENDWVVYGDDPIASQVSNIVAYRDGDDWYNALGEFVKDPREFSDINPIPITAANDESQLNLQSPSYIPSLSFEDYEPQITLMPRLAFSFNMSENAQFFAHYDQLAQRPQGRSVATAYHYYFLVENNISTLNNPNLRPEKTIDYQIGFKQLLSKSSALTIAGFYREIKDLIQYSLVNFAYPREYGTFLNRDFGTIKGLELTYDLRRTGNVRLNTTYTLQFAEGTGSDDVSGFNVVSSGQPNLRAIAPLDYDSRHLFVSSLDYRFGDGSKYNGPKIGDLDVLANFGVNVTLRARSGEPYSKQRSITPTAIIGRAGRNVLDGSINGSRLPWNAKVDIRADKDFIWESGKKDGGAKREYSASIYLQIQNLFNTQNIINVYQFTGIPGDDGYLNSTEGLIEQEQVANKQSFVDLYQISVNNPNNYSRPRTIRLGAAFNF